MVIAPIPASRFVQMRCEVCNESRESSNLEHDQPTAHDKVALGS
ncbi:hypothetical protein [Stieleria varia]|nr:hypothetical protein [Stieleria varia]